MSLELPPLGARHSPAAERNRQPILQLLQQMLSGQGLALEIASGTGQHAAWFAQGLPDWTWQPTDAQSDAFGSIRAWCAQAGVTNVREPLVLDVLAPQWPAVGSAFNEAFDAIFCANMLHISPWATCGALMHGAARHLAPEGALIVYGPFLEPDLTTSPGNLAFDQSLRERDADWGIRMLNDVVRQATQAGLRIDQRIAMPANNLLLVFKHAQVFTARIGSDGAAFEAWAHQPLLMSAERAGIAWPGSCRNGTCRTCIGRLTQGQVRYEIEWPGLSAQEKVEGYVLPCAAYPMTDVVLLAPGA